MWQPMVGAGARVFGRSLRMLLGFDCFMRLVAKGHWRGRRSLRDLGRGLWTMQHRGAVGGGRRWSMRLICDAMSCCNVGWSNDDGFTELWRLERNPTFELRHTRDRQVASSQVERSPRVDWLPRRGDTISTGLRQPPLTPVALPERVSEDHGMHADQREDPLLDRAFRPVGVQAKRTSGPAMA